MKTKSETFIRLTGKVTKSALNGAIHTSSNLQVPVSRIDVSKKVKTFCHHAHTLLSERTMSNISL
jgi:hypothetical protein